MAFDTRVHIRDRKSGEVNSTQPYRFVCNKEQGSWFERGGVRYSADGKELGPVGENGPKLIGEAAQATPAKSQGDASVSVSRSEPTFPSSKENRK